MKKHGYYTKYKGMFVFSYQKWLKESITAT